MFCPIVTQVSVLIDTHVPIHPLGMGCVILALGSVELFRATLCDLCVIVGILENFKRNGSLGYNLH